MNNLSNRTAELEALQMETDGYHFFKDASESSQNILAKETFKSFAQWELEHIEFIKKMHQELKPSGKWMSTDQTSQKTAYS